MTPLWSSTALPRRAVIGGTRQRTNRIDVRQQWNDGGTHVSFSLIHARMILQQQPACSDYPIAFAIWKIGRYMAMTMKPMIVPRKTIMTGSRREVSAPTAWSTSSS